LKKQKTSNKKENNFYFKNIFSILVELLKFSVYSFEQIITSLSKPITPRLRHLNTINIIKKTTKLLDLLNIKSCFLRSIILYKMLKKYNHEPKLHIGVKKVDSLESHAWIEIDNTSIDTSKGYEILTTIK
jgi:hypothetical protein